MTSAIMDAYSFDEYNENLYENGSTDGKAKRKKVNDIDLYNNSVKKICNENNCFPSPPSYGSQDNYFPTKEHEDILGSPAKPIKQEITDSQAHPCNTSDTSSQQQQQTLMPKKEPFPQAFISLPHKVELDSSVSNLQWLHSLSSPQNDQKSQQRQPHAVASQQISHTQSQASVHNNNPNHNIQIINLPNNVQISNGTIQYVNNRSQNPPILIGSKVESAMRSQPFNQVSYPGAGYVLSPNSAKPTSTVADSLYPKPPYSYSCLIALALKNSTSGSLPVAEIYNFMTRNFPYFKTAPDGWKNSVRHNLSLNKCFEKIENPNSDGINSRKGCLWALNPQKLKKMDEEILKWSRKDNNAIKRAMPNPDILEVLEKGQELSLPNRSSHVNHQMNQYNVNHAIHPQQSSYHMLPSGGAMRMMRSGSMSSSTYSHPSPTLQNNNGVSHEELSSHNNNQLVNNHRHNQQSSGEHMLSSYNTPTSTQQTDMSGYQFHADQEFNLDPSLTELAIQTGFWDDLPSELLDLPFSNSPMHLSPAIKYTAPSTDGAVDQNVSDQRVINAT